MKTGLSVHTYLSALTLNVAQSYHRACDTRETKVIRVDLRISTYPMLAHLLEIKDVMLGGEGDLRYAIIYTHDSVDVHAYTEEVVGILTNMMDLARENNVQISIYKLHTFPTDQKMLGVANYVTGEVTISAHYSQQYQATTYGYMVERIYKQRYSTSSKDRCIVWDKRVQRADVTMSNLLTELHHESSFE